LNSVSSSSGNPISIKASSSKLKKERLRQGDSFRLGDETREKPKPEYKSFEIQIF
jgi:hypothetical protein